MEIPMLYFECWVCGLPFGISRHFRDTVQGNDGFFFCPKGCKLGLGESDLTKLKRETEANALRAQARINEAKHAQLVAEKAAKKAVADKRKLERRIAHGVCPCCNKTFADISNHMMTEHRDFRLPAGKQTKQIEGAA